MTCEPCHMGFHAECAAVECGCKVEGVHSARWRILMGGTSRQIQEVARGD